MEGESLEAFAGHCANKLLFLEEKLGRQTGYEILDPFHVETQDPCAVQDAAKRIAAHIRLPTPTPLVAFSSKEEGIGGDVEIREGGREAYIEISPQAKVSAAAVCAILSHELTHVALSLWGISEGPGPIYERANEQLTDIAAVFLGLGKLLLNGKNVSSRTVRQGPAGTEVVTAHLRQGYLSDDQLAITYRMVCAMRAIPDSTMRSGLSPRALELVDGVGHLRERWFSPKYRDPDYMSSLTRKATDRLNILKERAQALAKEIECVNRQVLDLAYKELDRVERALSDSDVLIGQTLRRYDTDSQYDPCWRFLANLHSRESLRAALEKTERVVEGALDVRTIMKRFLTSEQDSVPTFDSRELGARRSLLSFLARICKREKKE